MGKKYTRVEPAKDVLGEAEYWFVCLLDPGCSQEDRAAFARWRLDSDVHAAAYRQVEQLWAMGDEAVRGDPALMAAAQQALRQPRIHPKRRWLVPGLAAAAILVLALLLVPGWFARQSAGTDYATAIDQQRTLTLKDGTRILLDTNSQVRVRYTDAARRVDLLRGRAQFKVQHNSQWPFVVHALNGTVTDLGTTFQVSLDGNKVNVVLLKGQLAIATHVDGKERHATLKVRQRLTFDRSGALGPAQPADMTLAKGWTAGKLFVHDWRLPRLLTAMNRYSTVKLEIADPALRNLRISGVFQLGDQHTLLQVLHKGWSIHAEPVAPNKILLSHD